MLFGSNPSIFVRFKVFPHSPSLSRQPTEIRIGLIKSLILSEKLYVSGLRECRLEWFLITESFAELTLEQSNFQSPKD